MRVVCSRPRARKKKRRPLKETPFAAFAYLFNAKYFKTATTVFPSSISPERHF